MAKPKTTTASGPTMLEDRIVEEPNLSSQIGFIGGGVTPLMVSGVLANADLGYQYRLVDLFHDARQKDGTLQAAMALAELSVSQLKWQVKPPAKASRKEKKLAEAFSEAFSEAENRGSFIEHSIGERRAFGHSSTEVMWGMRSGYLAPQAFKPISCRRFGFRQSDGALVFAEHATGDLSRGIELLKEFTAGKFVQTTQRINGDVPAREGLARMLCWLSIGRNWTYRDWMQLAELAWKPKRLGKYKRGIQDDDKRILKTILRDIMTSGSAIHPDDVEINLLWPQGSSSGGGGAKSVHKELLQWLGAEICKAIIGSADQLEPGENGSRNATEARADNPKMIRNASADTLADSITCQLVRPFTIYNGGERVRAGRFEFITDDPLDLAKFAKAVKDLKDASMRIPEQWASDSTNIPIPSVGERILGGTPERPDEFPEAPEKTEPASADNAKDPTENGQPSGGEKPTED
jgi:phage gp29-like protein